MTMNQPTYNTPPEAADSDYAPGMKDAKSLIRQAHPLTPSLKKRGGTRLFLPLLFS
jgi:hypothetical protein